MVAGQMLARESFCSQSFIISMVKGNFLCIGLASNLFTPSNVLLTRGLTVGKSLPAKE